MLEYFRRAVVKPMEEEELLGTVGDLLRQGFCSDAIRRLIGQRARYADGELNEWPEEYHRLRFARWLYEQGKIEG